MVTFVINDNRTSVIQRIKNHITNTEQKTFKKISSNRNMYKIIWKFKIKPELRNEFEAVYQSDGKWAQLFRQATGYVGTELLHDVGEDPSYITIDTWVSLKDFEEFKIKWKNEYRICDQECEKLTVSETYIGSFYSVGVEQ